MADDTRSPDELLMAQAQRGDLQAFDELVERHHRLVYGWVYRFAGRIEVAEEWTQEIFLRVFERRARYDPGRPFLAWLRRVTVNWCLNAADARVREPLSLDALRGEEESGWEAPAPDPLPEEVLAREETRALVRRAVHRLPPAYRAVVLLRYFDDLPYSAIAETLDLPLGTVKTHLHRAKAALRAELRTHGGGEEPWMDR